MAKYTKIAANEYHAKIRSVEEIESGYWRGCTVGLFLEGKPIGSGDLRVINRKRKHLHTECTGLKDKLRRKGHGIRLYLALIDAAKEMGAVRLYSSRRLNKYSRRMWEEKLSALFIVKGGRKSSKRCKCRQCYFHYRRRYYIDLVDLSKRPRLNMELS